MVIEPVTSSSTSPVNVMPLMPSTVPIVRAALFLSVIDVATLAAMVVMAFVVLVRLKVPLLTNARLPAPIAPLIVNDPAPPM